MPSTIPRSRRRNLRRRLTGLVTIDNQESYEFSQKQNLIINAGAGNDEINLNDPTSPPAWPPLPSTLVVAGETITALCVAVPVSSMAA